jgi:membrane protein
VPPRPEIAQGRREARVLNRGRIAGLLRSAWHQYERDYTRYFASAMVYYALFSLVPLLLLFLAGLGLVLRFSDAATTAERQVLSAAEASFGAELTATIHQLSADLQQQSIVASVVSLVGLLLTASVLFRNLRLAFRAIWKHAPPLVSGSVRSVVRATVLEYATSYLLVLLGGLLLLVSLVLVAVTQWLSGLVSGLPRLGDTAGWLLALPTPLILATTTFALLFKCLPPVRLPWRHVRLAAVLCGIAWMVAAEVLALYGIFFGSSLSTYGAIGGLLVLMLWLNVVAQVLFFGGELCKVVSLRETSASVT